MKSTKKLPSYTTFEKLPTYKILKIFLVEQYVLSNNTNIIKQLSILFIYCLNTWNQRCNKVRELLWRTGILLYVKMNRKMMEIRRGVPSKFWRLMINLGQCNISHSYSIKCRNKVSDQQGVRPKSDPSGLQLSWMHMWT